ncbi:MAG: signal peptide peptidase SppA [Phycisphaeraceae bacterium]
MPHRLLIITLLTAMHAFALDAVGAENKPVVEPEPKFLLAPIVDEDPFAEEDTGPLVGWLELKGELAESPAPFSLMPGQREDSPFAGIIKRLKHVAAKENYKGLVIYLNQPGITNSQVQEISDAVQLVRKSGKKVLFFAEAYDLRNYALACSGDKILLQKNGFLELTGVGVEEIYLAGLFEKIGIKADFVQTGKYKGADEMFTRTGPSEAWSENFENLLDDIYNQIIDRIAKARDLKPNAIEKAMEQSLTSDAQAMVKAGLIDKIVARDLKDVTGELFGNDFAWDRTLGEAPNGGVDMDNPFAMMQMFMAPPKPHAKRDSIVLIHCHGPIMSGESSFGGLFGGATVGSDSIVGAMNDARRDPLVKGVVVHVNSPGGSALASEIIWQAMRELAKEKPVYVSISSLAASGGYYIACGADKIYANPGSIVGSIGVVSGKLAMGGLFEWAGIGIHRRSRGPHGDMFNMVEPFTLEEKKALAAMSDRIYEQFVGRVKATRGEKIKSIDKVAQGRLFTGSQGLKNGMVDHVAGVEVALADLAEQVGLEPGKYDVLNLPQSKSLPEYLSELLGVSRNVPGLRVHLTGDQLGVLNLARTALGPRGWQAVQQAMEGIMLLRSERVLTLMPNAVIVK